MGEMSEEGAVRLKQELTGGGGIVARYTSVYEYFSRTSLHFPVLALPTNTSSFRLVVVVVSEVVLLQYELYGWLRK